MLWVLVVFICLSLLDIWPKLPPLVHLLAFVCVVVAIILGLGAAIGSWRRHREAEPVRWGYHLVWVPTLFVAIFLAGSDWERRMTMAFKPGLLFSPPDMKVTAWITPPAYAKLAPISLPVSGKASQPIKVPAGSVLRVEVQSTRWPPVLGWAKKHAVLRPTEDGNHAIDGELHADGRVRLTYAGKTIVRWDITVTPDLKPTIKFAQSPRSTARQSLRLDLDAVDDHGIEYLALRLKAADGSGLEHVVELPAYGKPVLREPLFVDLTAHVLAGEDVQLQVVAFDGLSQQATSEWVKAQLPKRQFTNPLSLALIGTRASLMGFEEDDVIQSIRRLRLLTEAPPAVSDATVHLGLRSAYIRLKSAYGYEEQKEVADLLWALALRAEDGGKTLSETELAESLDQALLLVRREASADEVEAALVGLAEAFDNYGRQRVRNQSMIQADSIDWEAVQRLLLRFNDMLEAGNYLQLGEQILNIRAGLEEQPALLLSVNAYRHFVVASYARRVLDEMLRQQTQIAQRTKIDGANEGLSLASDQVALRDAMAELIEQLSRAGIPDMSVFVSARAAMDQAVTALTEGAPENIAESQQHVSDQLKRATEKLAAFPTLGRDPSGHYRDPLGRPVPPAP